MTSIKLTLVAAVKHDSDSEYASIKMPSLDLKGTKLNVILAIVGAMAFALQGYDQAVMNGLLTLDTFVERFPQINTSSKITGAQKSHHALIQGTTVALYEVGCAVGALCCYVVNDFLGRRRTIFLAACILLIGIIIQATPFALGQLIAGRIITGLGVGAFTATVPVWVSECAKAEWRGRLVLLEGWFAIGGIVVATWIEFGLFYVKNNSVNWRFPIAFQGLFAVVVISIVLLLPESPRWLIKKDRPEEAAKVLAQLNGLPQDSEGVAQEVTIIQQSILDEHVGHSDSPFAATRNRHLHRTVLAISVNILAQMTGVNIVTFYSTSIFQTDFHYSGTTSRIISACLQVWQFFCAGLAVLLIDRFGRRTLLISAAVGMAISQACLAGLSSDLENKSAAGAAFFFYFGALFFFPIGLFLIPFMYAAEISPLRIRAKVTAMSASANWLFNFLLAEVTPVGFANIGYRYYIVYACIAAFAAVVLGLFYPETKSRSLEEIDEIFLQSHSIWDPVRIARELPMHIPLDIEDIKHAQEKDAGDRISRIE